MKTYKPEQPCCECHSKPPFQTEYEIVFENNHCTHLPKPYIDIIPGETCIHSFDVPFNVEQDCANVEVIYQLGIDPIIIKGIYFLNILVEPDKPFSTVVCTLSPEETKQFGNKYLDTRVQLKFYMNGGNISYSDIYRVRVFDSLDLNRKSTTPTSDVDMVFGVGYGYTED